MNAALEELMSNKPTDLNGPTDPERREILRAASGAAISGVAITALAMPSPTVAENAASGDRDNGPLGGRLQGVQHFGLTVQNMDRAFEFYTEVLGGKEVMRDGDFHGEKIQDTLMADQEIVAHERKVNPRTIGVPDLRSGEQRLDVRFVQFDNAVLELLQYRDAKQPMGNGDSWAEPRDHMSPAYPRSMHICFYIRDDVDFNKFVHDLEAEAARRGMTQVKANRIIMVTSEQARQSAPIDTNSNKITSGKSNGWALIYCKGPDGEQLEFVQALDPVRKTFHDALEARHRMLAGNR
jgi:catechol 2,3-dioxygenase-like lactoylglutathione lyase family enzyme